MLDKEDVATAKEIAKVLRESKVDELVVAGNLITVLLAEREQQRTWERPWVSLTDDDLSDVYNSTDWNITEDWGYERAIEAKLKEKNT